LEGPDRARAALGTLEDAGIPAGVLTPFEAVVQGGDPAGVASAISGVDGVRDAVAPDGDNWNQDGLTVVPVMLDSNGSGSAAESMLGQVRDAAHGAGDDVLVGGQIATDG